MTSRSTWKAWERAIARRLGTERTPLSGGASRHTLSDTLDGAWFIEAKLRRGSEDALRAWARKAFEETLEGAASEGKVPVLVFRRKGEDVLSGIAVVPFEFLAKLREHMALQGFKS